jgi:hypothetical protein
MTLEEALLQIEVLKKQLDLYQYSYGQMVKHVREFEQWQENRKKQYIQIED